MAINETFGTDISTFPLQGDPNLDETFTLIGGERVVLEALARRLMTPRGFLDYDPDYGLDLRAYLSAKMTAPKQSALVAEIKSECKKDERVSDAQVTISGPDYSTHTMRVTISATVADGNAFDLVLDVSQARVTLLEAA